MRVTEVRHMYIFVRFIQNYPVFNTLDRYRLWTETPWTETPWTEIPPTATGSAGTHPTGMHIPVNIIFSE